MFRHIIHLHIPAFSIALARICEPRLRDRPVAVAPPQSERSLILSVSSEARKEGVFKGMPLGRAMKLCPDLMVLPPNPERTEKASKTLAKLVSNYTPIWEPSRPGHIYLDVTGTERLWGRAKDTAFRLRRETKDRLYLPGTAGVAGNKMVSGIASRIMPSEGVLDVDHGREAPFMAPLKVDVVPGIGRFRKKILLEELNIIRVRELVALDMGSLKLIFGREAFVIQQRALGIDSTPVYPLLRKPVVSEEITLSKDENDDEKLLGSLYGLVERCAYRMRTRSLFPRKAGVLIRYSDQMEAQRRMTLCRSSFWDFDLYDSMERLFLRACDRRIRVRFLKVWFWDFFCSDFQLSLFHEPSPAQRKKALVVQSMDCIRKRYGEEAIRLGR